MPRQLRIEYPGAVYQVMNRGDRRKDIFHETIYQLLARPPELVNCWVIKTTLASASRASV